jgi:predicted nucleotidyltransferase
MATDALRKVAATLADWATAGPGYTVYLFGSFVRGDNHEGSDVDIFLDLTGPVDEDTVWWKVHNEETDYQDIKSKLPGPLKILHPDSTLVTGAMLRAAPVVYLDRNVRCVWLPPYK